MELNAQKCVEKQNQAKAVAKDKDKDIYNQ